MDDSQLKLDVLELISQNSRQSSETIGSMLNVDKETVERIIKQLEREKVILKYSALIDWDKAESDKVTALIDVRVDPQREVGFDKVARRIYLFPEVKSLYLMSGTYDLSVLVEGHSLKEVAFFVSNRLATLEHVVSTTTHFILKRYKEDGVVFEDGESDKRMVVTP